MKRMFVILALLVTAYGCTDATQPAGNTTNTANANAANTNAASPAAATTGVSEQDLIANEKQLWDAIRRKDPAAFGNFLADDQLYVTSDGIHDKAATIKSVGDLDIKDLSLTDFKLVKIDNDAAVLTYVADTKGTYAGQPIPPQAGRQRNSTAWINRGGKWVAVFHQDSTIMEMPPTPPTDGKQGAASSSPSAGSSPASTGITTGADATANEKQVWEAFKRNDWNAFASVVADDALEVESEGLYTKTQMIDGMKNSDVSKFTASDFRESNLDEDAKLVTYVVTGPGRNGKTESQRHSSIWVNRGGRWQAVFHQGTEAMKPPNK